MAFDHHSFYGLQAGRQLRRNAQTGRFQSVNRLKNENQDCFVVEGSPSQPVISQDTFNETIDIGFIDVEETECEPTFCCESSV